MSSIYWKDYFFHNSTNIIFMYYKPSINKTSTNLLQNAAKMMHDKKHTYFHLFLHTVSVIRFSPILHYLLGTKVNSEPVFMVLHKIN